MKFTIRKYEKHGWQIWDSENEPYMFDVTGEDDRFFLVALIRFIWNKINKK